MVIRAANEHPGYSEFDRARFLDEPAKRGGRTEFARDRARIIHSFALRRLAAKTQVAVPWATDFPRTRLSHSLECAQVGRELGAALGADPDLMEGACLAHDIGHPPFGHNGEEALNQIAASCGGFEGNAQSIRLLIRLEAKTVLPDGKSIGLNLTRASLDAATKYPWSRAVNARKFGVYEDDLEIFNWYRSGVESGKTSMEAQIMDWSDDVAYSVHDLEDSLVSGQVKLDQLSNDLPKLFKVAQDMYLADITEKVRQLQDSGTRERLSKKCKELPASNGGAEIAKILFELATKSNTNKPAKFTYARLIVQDHVNRGLRHIANLGLRRVALVYRFLNPHIVTEIVKEAEPVFGDQTDAAQLRELIRGEARFEHLISNASDQYKNKRKEHIDEYIKYKFKIKKNKLLYKNPKIYF